MGDGGGRGQQLVLRQEIYFLDQREHSPEYPGVYPDIRAGLLRFIIRWNPSARGILAIRHGTLPSRLDARWPGRRGGARSVAVAVRQPHGEGRRLRARLHAQLAEQG
jgi:hypothetical protein